MTTHEYVGIVAMVSGMSVIVRIKLTQWFRRPKPLRAIPDRVQNQALLAKKAAYLETLRKLDRISERNLHG